MSRSSPRTFTERYYSLSVISRELIMCVPKVFSQRQISHFIINLLP